MNTIIIGPVFGLIQFASMYAEFSYLFDSIFKAQMYAMFGFLLLNLILQIAIISLLSILQTYMQLCYQNYEWWWRSFAVGASGTLYMILYAVFFALTKLKINDPYTDIAFLIYVFLFIGCYSLGAGTIAVQASYYFVSNIYSDIRVD